MTLLARFIPVIFLATAGILLSAGSVMADLHFYLQEDYILGHTETRDPSLGVTHTRSQSLDQKYRLNFTRQLYPNLFLGAGALFERIDSSQKGDVDIDNNANRLSPFINLNLNAGLYQAGVGFQRQEIASSTSLSGKQPTLVRDSFNAFLGWTPLDLPKLQFNYSLDHNYDTDYLLQDVRTRTLQVSTRYTPISQVDLGYQWADIHTKNLLVNSEGDIVQQSARVDYSDRLFDDRVDLNAGYQLGLFSFANRFQGVGELVQPLAGIGLSALSDTPETVQLTPDSALSDGNWNVPTSIVLAYSPLATPPPNSIPRNLGVQIPVGTDHQVNGLFVGVAPASGLNLPALDPTSFSWAVYVSKDNFHWTLHQTVNSAPFEINPLAGASGFGFNIRFATVDTLKTPYIKVVTAPAMLPAGGPQDSPEVFVTEIRATLTETGAGRETKSSATTNRFSTSATTRILDNPNVNWDFNAFYFQTAPTGFSSWSLRNGLTASKRLRPWLTGQAQISREDSGSSVGEHDWNFTYSTSLAAHPLPTVLNTLGYSGRRDQKGWSNALSTSNRFGLYPGIDMRFTAGASLSNYTDGAELSSYQTTLSTSLRPHPSMSGVLSLSYSQTHHSGGDQPEMTNTTLRNFLGVSFNPTPALSLSYNITYNRLNDEDQTLQNWGANWSPFRGGALQLFFHYNETLQPTQDARSRLLSSGARWQIRPGTFLDLSYSRIDSLSGGIQSISNFFYSSLKLVL